jgi:hypothetical protein
VPTFVDRGVSRGQRGGSPTVVNLRFENDLVNVIPQNLIAQRENSQTISVTTACTLAENQTSLQHYHYTNLLGMMVMVVVYKTTYLML